MRSTIQSHKILTLLALGFALNQAIVAQNGILLNTEEATDSYTLFESSSGNYLVDNCGDIINLWNVVGADNHAKLLPNGNLIYIRNNQVRELDWNGDVVNIVANPNNEINLEYEVILLPSGNYLCLGRKALNEQGFIDLGYDFGAVTTPNVVDVVVELDRESGEIVWLWNIADHVIQQRDPEANNYGILSESPGLLNMDAISGYDWNFHESFMINGMDYNPTLDQIVLSVRKIGEFVIIDHSTTTEEAAGHTGGNAGKGGDILYRWGNPENYGRGEESDRHLYFQHNPNWITEGEHTGKIICYNNRLGVPGVPFEDRYSSIPVVEPPVDEFGIYILEEEQAYGPASPTLQYDEITTNTFFYSSYTSGAEYLPNGNIFITEGQTGRLLEINPAGETVWIYVAPQAGYIFRAEKYPANYEAFTDRELVTVGPHPFATSTYDCMLMTTTSNDIPTIESTLAINYNAITKQINIENIAGNGFQYSLYDLQGHTLLKSQTRFSTKSLDIGYLPTAMYILTLTDPIAQQTTSFKIIK